MKAFGMILRGGDRRVTVVLLGATVLMTLYLYQGQPAFFLRHFAPEGASGDYWDWAGRLWEFGAMFLLWAIIPALMARYLLGMKLSSLGVTLGDARFGLKAMLVAAPLLVPALWVNSLDPEFQAEYPLVEAAGASVGAFALWQAARLVYYAAWEFFFRGFMLFGVRRRFGDFAAIAIQTIPSTIIHIGKPEGEMLAAIVGGVLLGAVAIRTRSVFYPFLIHWWVGGWTDFFCG